MSAQDYFQGLALTAFQLVLTLAVLRGCYRLVRYTHRHRAR